MNRMTCSNSQVTAAQLETMVAAFVSSNNNKKKQTPFRLVSNTHIHIHTCNISSGSSVCCWKETKCVCAAECGIIDYFRASRRGGGVNVEDWEAS